MDTVGSSVKWILRMPEGGLAAYMYLLSGVGRVLSALLRNRSGEDAGIARDARHAPSATGRLHRRPTCSSERELLHSST